MKNKKTIAGCTLALTLFANLGAALAYTELYRFQYCSSVNSEVERLRCYDNFARELGLAPADSVGTLSASQERFGLWTVRTESTRGHNYPSVFAFTEAKSVALSPKGTTAIPTLVARCFNGYTELYLAFGSSFPVKSGPVENSVLYFARWAPKRSGDVIRTTDNGEDEKEIEVTFGKQKALRIKVGQSSDGLAYFFPNPVSYIKQLEHHDRIAVSYLVDGGKPVEVEFALDGFESALKPLRQNCSW